MVQPRHRPVSKGDPRSMVLAYRVTRRRATVGADMPNDSLNVIRRARNHQFCSFRNQGDTEDYLFLPPWCRMVDFDVAPLEGFVPSVALERMLRLLLSLFEEVSVHKKELILPASQEAFSYHLEEAFMNALEIARADTEELIRNLQTVDFTLSEKEYLRLSGPMLRLKMMAIKAAVVEANGVHPLHGDAPQRGWALYRRSLVSLFKMIDSPLDTLTRVVDGPRGAIALKNSVEGLLYLKSGPTA